MTTLSKIHRMLEVSSTIAVLVAAVAVLWMIYDGRLGPARSPGSMYAVGDRFDAAKLIPFDDAPMALVIWVRSSCRYCTESMGFYRQLIASERSVRVVMMGVERQGVLQKYASDHQFEPDAIVSGEGAGVRLSATPVLLLVDRSGIIRSIWRGQLRQTGDQQKVLDSLR